MRLERSHPWGFDDGDPRLELRRAAAEAQRDVAAAEAQRDVAAAELPDADDLPLADNQSTDAEEWELPWVQRATEPMAPAISRK